MTGIRFLLGGMIAAMLAGAAQASPQREALALLPVALPSAQTASSATIDPMSAAMVEALAGGVDAGILDRRDAAAIAKFYAERDHRPVWIVDGRYTPAAQAAMARIARADEDGLGSGPINLD